MDGRKLLSLFLLAYCLAVSIGVAEGADIDITLPPGWNALEPTRDEVALCELRDDKDRAVVLLRLRRIDFGSPEEAEGFADYLRNKARYDESTTLLKNSDGTLAGYPSIVHQVVEKTPEGTLQREMSYLRLESSWYVFEFSTLPEDFGRLRDRFAEFLRGVRITASGGVVSSPAASPGAESTGTQALQAGPASPVVVREGALAFEVPREWSAVPPSDPSASAYFVLREGSGARAEFLFYREEFPSPVTLDTYFQAVESEGQNSFKSYRRLDLKRTSLAGLEALRLEFLFTVEGNPAQLKGLFYAVVTETETEGYGFLFDAASSDFDALLPAFERILASVRRETAGASSPAGAHLVHQDPAGLFAAPLPSGATVVRPIEGGTLYRLPGGEEFQLFAVKDEATAEEVRAKVAEGKRAHGSSVVQARGRQAQVFLYSSPDAAGVSRATVVVRFAASGVLLVVTLPAAEYGKAQEWLLPFIKGFSFR
ncbi:hypothetical protein [Aminiphilus sp.]|uniref:hypothetical protein n=1 Tax=Aminiphilus sp. TaxID=1872488 RepID=UPI002636B2AB|nr:hypothetical protein [Aminiphilus sp.]